MRTRQRIIMPGWVSIIPLMIIVFTANAQQIASPIDLQLDDDNSTYSCDVYNVLLNGSYVNLTVSEWYCDDLSLDIPTDNQTDYFTFMEDAGEFTTDDSTYVQCPVGENSSCPLIFEYHEPDNVTADGDSGGSGSGGGGGGGGNGQGNTETTVDTSNITATDDNTTDASRGGGSGGGSGSDNSTDTVDGVTSDPSANGTNSGNTTGSGGGTGNDATDGQDSGNSTTSDEGTGDAATDSPDSGTGDAPTDDPDSGDDGRATDTPDSGNGDSATDSPDSGNDDSATDSPDSGDDDSQTEAPDSGDDGQGGDDGVDDDRGDDGPAYSACAGPHQCDRPSFRAKCVDDSSADEGYRCECKQKFQGNGRRKQCKLEDRFIAMPGATSVEGLFSDVFEFPLPIYIQSDPQVLANFIRVQKNGCFGFYEKEPTTDLFVPIPQSRLPIISPDSNLKALFCPYGAIINIEEVTNEMEVAFYSQENADDLPNLEAIKAKCKVPFDPTLVAIAKLKLKPAVDMVGPMTNTIEFQGVVATDGNIVKGYFIAGDQSFNWGASLDETREYPAAMGIMTAASSAGMKRGPRMSRTFTEPDTLVFNPDGTSVDISASNYEEAGQCGWDVNSVPADFVNAYYSCSAEVAGLVDMPQDMRQQCSKCPSGLQQELLVGRSIDADSPSGYSCITSIHPRPFTIDGLDYWLKRSCCYDESGEGLYTDVVSDAYNLCNMVQADSKPATAADFPSLASIYATCCQDIPYCGSTLQGKRPVACSANYNGMKQASSNGDPHIFPLDGGDSLLYNGEGIYDLLICDVTDGFTFKIQAFIENMLGAGDANVAAVFVGFAMKSGDSPPIEIQKTGTTTDSLTLYVDSQVVDITSSDSHHDEFYTYNVYVTDTGSWRVVFGGGNVAVLTVTEVTDAKALSLTIQLNSQCKDNVSGMMGNYDGVADENDIKARDETVYTPSDAAAGPQQCDYFNTLLSWCVQSADDYLGQDGATDFCTAGQTCTALPTSCDGSDAACPDGGSACSIDFCTTGDASFAGSTASQQQTDAAIAAIMENTAPAITSGMEAVVWEANGDSATLDLNTVISDVDGQTLSFIITGCPASLGTLSIDAATSVLSWTVAADITTLDPSSLAGCVITAADGVCASNITLRIQYCCVAEGRGTCGEAMGNGAFAVRPSQCSLGWEGACCNLDQAGCAASPCFGGCNDVPATEIVDESTPAFTCEPCPEGRPGVLGMNCTDVNECETGAATCAANTEQCVNTIGSYTCQCAPGFVRNPDTQLCEDINECTQQNQCDGKATCTNNDGSYSCQCIDGYEGNGFSCGDINECNGDNAIQCGENAECENIPGSYLCQCLPGYAKAPPPADQTACPTNINDCEPTNNCSQTCVDEVQKYTCTCNEGYTLADDGQQCTANTACDSAPEGVQCTQIDGTDTFCCSDSEVLDGNQCIDKDECALGEDSCNLVTSQCVNIAGGFNCQCKDGYERGDGNTCDDIDECAQSDTNACSQQCVNTDGSYLCACADGFILNSDGKACDDFDECAAGADSCSPLATCENKQGGYECNCDSGYTGNGFQCEDENECANDNNGCQQVCVNSVGGCSCACQIGYTPNADGKKCDDVDECQSSHDCWSNDHCTNTIGSYTCSCPDGMLLTGDMKTCQVGVSCAAGNSCPTENAKTPENCAKIAGTDTCLCQTGYEYNADTNQCADIDECTLYSDICPAANNVKCVNNDGSYTCDCIDDTFEPLTDTSCKDKDECANTPCQGAVCVNKVGGFDCTCYSGYSTISATQCQDVNECASENNCDTTNGGCDNTLGSYRCNCNAGYQVDVDGHTCIDVNECQLGTDNCPSAPTGLCTNIIGSFTCSCTSGFSMYGSTCMDIDECATGNHECSQTCDNTIGGYKCSCQDGYGLASDGKTCDPTVPCAADNQCAQICAKIGDVDTCGCYNDSYVLKDTACEDVDECAEGNMGCIGGADQVSCTNLAPGFSCSCLNDFKLSADGRQCVDRDGVWGEWGEHSECTKTCGSMMVQRNRTCEKKAGNGLACIGVSIEYKDCARSLCDYELKYAAGWTFDNVSVVKYGRINSQIMDKVAKAINVECRKSPSMCCGTTIENAPDLSSRTDLSSVTTANIHQTTASPRSTSSGRGGTIVSFLVYPDRESDLCVAYSAGTQRRRRAAAPEPTEDNTPMQQADLIHILNQEDTIKDVDDCVNAAYPDNEYKLLPATAAQQVEEENDVKKKDDNGRGWVIPVAIVCVLLAVAILIVIIVVVIKKPSKVNDQA